MKAVEWDEDADIYHRTEVVRGPPRTRAVHNGPLNWLITIAINGHEGPLENLFIRTKNNLDYEPEQILELSRRPDRPPLKKL